MKQRADQLLVARGLAASLEKARAMIMAGLVSSRGERVERAGTILDAEAALGVKETLLYVSRAGAKLAQALDAFGVDPAGKVAADIGASTGGFTDCLLRRGARKVYAVDVNTKQLDWRLRRDERVFLVEKNARNLVPGDFKERPDIITLDVSFISILKVLPALKNVLTGVEARAGGSRGEGAGDRARAGRGGRGRERGRTCKRWRAPGPHQAAVRGGPGASGEGRDRARSGRPRESPGEGRYRGRRSRVQGARTPAMRDPRPDGE